MDKLSPFDFLTTINTKNDYLMEVPEITEKQYNPFIVNRGLSQFSDTVFIANEMNRLYHLDKRLQYDFLFHLVRKKKRYGKWAKKEDVKNLEHVKNYFNVNDQLALSYMKLMDKSQIKEIVDKMTRHLKN